MIVHLKILHLVLLVLSIKITKCDETTAAVKDDLMESESKDPTKVEIIKQIKRVNDDGSYTFGYEAEDGTFKIESRDVLGNIKGTFGFVDADGEIKRVSYSSTNSTESATISSTEKERSSVIQQIPKLNNRTISSTTRRPNIIYPSPSSTVIQTIPRRRISSSSSSSTSSSKDTNNSSTSSGSSSTDRPSYKNLVKSNDFDITTTARSSTTESPIRTSSNQPRPTGHFIRSTISPIAEAQRYTEGQLIRPTHPESVTARPTESYPRRILINRNHYLEETGSSTIKPIVENSYDDTMRSNLLRRQLSQEKITNFDPRQHVLNLQQSAGDDSTDVYSASLTTGPPRPLFTTSDRPRLFPTPTVPTIKGITPAKYQTFYQKNLARGIRPTSNNYLQEATTTDSTNADTSYVTPNPVSVVQIPNSEESIPIRRHPYHRGAYLIPVNQYPGGRYVLQEPHEDVSQQQYVAQYAIPVQSDQQYLRETTNPISYQVIPKRRPIPVVALDDYQSHQPQEVNLFTPNRYPMPVQITSNDLQDEIDNIKPPVSTKDFQKLLNRLIVRQSQLQEISRIEQSRVMQPAYINPIYRPVQPTPVSIFVRNRPELRNTNGPVQFVPAPQSSRPKLFITMPQHHGVQTQKLMESQQQYNTADPYDNYQAGMYRSGRRVARLLHPNTHPKEDDNYLPPDVREMLLLRMLQLAINPNLPLPPSEGETMASQIRETKKQQVRNVEILGEERDEEKPVSRSKRYRESDEYYDY